MRAKTGGNGPRKEPRSNGFACEHLEPPFIGVNPVTSTWFPIMISFGLPLRNQ